MDNSSIREMFAREIKFLALPQTILELKRLNAIDDVRVSFETHLNEVNRDIYILRIPDPIVNQVWTEKVPFNLEHSLFARISPHQINEAKYVSGIPTEIYIDSIVYSVDGLLGEV